MFRNEGRDRDRKKDRDKDGNGFEDKERFKDEKSLEDDDLHDGDERPEGNEFFEAEEFAEFNRLEELDDEDQDTDSEPTWSKVFSKIIAVIIAVIFLAFALGSFLNIINMPSLDFLKESSALNTDPHLQSLQQAVVAVAETSHIPGAQLPGGSRRGTGFNIHPSGLIVTNRHLVKDAEAIVVSFTGGKSYRAASWVWSEQMDLGLIYLNLNESGASREEISLPVAKLKQGDQPAIGEEIIVMGNPLGFRKVISKGTVLDYHLHWGADDPILEIEAPIYPGSSGSPVFDTEDKVVGVVYAVILDSADAEEAKRGLAVSVSYLWRYMEEQGLQEQLEWMREQ